MRRKLGEQLPDTVWVIRWQPGRWDGKECIVAFDLDEVPEDSVAEVVEYQRVKPPRGKTKYGQKVS